MDEIKLFIGKSCLRGDELERDKEHPFSDGSGFPYKKDADGNYIKTGRTEAWFKIMAEIELCKLGYQKDALNTLISETQKTARENKHRERFYVYGLDGNQEFETDPCGDPLSPVPVKSVLQAMESSRVETDPYRRTEWAIALLSVMAKDPENLEVMFWGH